MPRSGAIRRLCRLRRGRGIRRFRESASKLAIAEALTAAGSGAGAEATKAGSGLRAAFGTLLTRAQDAGAVRRDAGPAEVYALLIGASPGRDLARARAGCPRPDARARLRRPASVRQRWQNWSRRRRVLIGLALAFVVLVPLPLGAYAGSLQVRYAGDPAAEAQTRNNDALWLGHAWVDGRKTEADVTALARQLEDTGIRDLYVHAGPLEHDGTLPIATVSPKARWFTSAMRAAAPGVRVQAWLGNLVQPGKNPGLDLDDAAVRTRVVASAAAVLDQGFQGIHFDFEPVHSGSTGFLAVLDETHVLTDRHGVPLSVAAAQLEPLRRINALPLALTGEGKWWSQNYFAEVARRVERIAVMSYDTAMPLESLYGGYVAQQTALSLAATPASTDLLMGLPAYWESNPSHWVTRRPSRRPSAAPASLWALRTGRTSVWPCTSTSPPQPPTGRRTATAGAYLPS
ncbi:SbtR family transcriptional regulator [Kribbella turkmenica]|uniref:SbtR family transcriptional regulator n=1 Tax=Kribbella turkmenica TaxID=2530375 RepID=UPI001F3C9FA9|nr:hypothetical protein [Kribbella turkmenica]